MKAERQSVCIKPLSIMLQLGACTAERMCARRDNDACRKRWSVGGADILPTYRLAQQHRDPLPASQIDAIANQEVTASAGNADTSSSEGNCMRLVTSAPMQGIYRQQYSILRCPVCPQSFPTYPILPTVR
ncbi:hypothetical protein K431DRAFT_147271 [Polychaeton citri CBS 116435]|uniref:Uncharacterized protein n=1 Tax=Polychaeton citri CBS 116435 TaxID=1314669 RepID=A0A9P4US45_9PEZI|nr:hypothetical protein K431DRAFT_147271 [Polychaeton citri CBS 116435]